MRTGDRRASDFTWFEMRISVSGSLAKAALTVDVVGQIFASDRIYNGDVG